MIRFLQKSAQARNLYRSKRLLSCMQTKYRLPHGATLNHSHSLVMHQPRMDKVAEGIVDVTKIAVVGSVGIGLVGAAGAAFQK